MTDIMPKVCKSPFSPLLAHSTVLLLSKVAIIIYTHKCITMTAAVHSEYGHYTKYVVLQEVQVMEAEYESTLRTIIAACLQAMNQRVVAI